MNIQNQSESFTDYEIFVQRVLAVSASSSSIVFGTIGVYLLISIDPKRFIFRHQLILFLLIFDLIKAVTLLIYPARLMQHVGADQNKNLCQAVGFFTAFAIEGADLAILTFAIHTYLLIFYPSLQTIVKNSTRYEGGLYRYRYYIYFTSFIIPVVMASLAFIKGYSSFVCWCYLPQSPVWYRFVLSWAPRYAILIIILIIYGLIYFHVIRQFKSLGGILTNLQKPKKKLKGNLTFFSALKFSLINFKKWLFNNKRTSNIVSSKLNSPLSSTSLSEESIGPNQLLFNPEIQEQNLENFKKRQKVIEKQMKSIFIYPFAYCSIWLFPFILQATQVNYEKKHGPILWLNYLGAFMQPLPGFVDACVLFYREQPWKYNTMAIFKKNQKLRIDSMTSKSNHHHHADRVGSDDSKCTTARLSINKTSISTKLQDDFDLESYSIWRKWFSWLRLPLFILPDEANVGKFNEQYINDKINEKDNGIPAKINTKNNDPHDFSNILAGDFSEYDLKDNSNEFHKNLNKFTLDFEKKTSNETKNKPKRTSIIPSINSNNGNSIPEFPTTISPSNTRLSVSQPKPLRAPLNRAKTDIQLPTQNRNLNRLSVRTADDDLDFLQMLKAGPPA